MLPLTAESKDDSLAVMLITTDAQVRERDTEDFSDNPTPMEPSLLQKKGTA